MFGYAVRETPELMPIPIALAHRLAERLTQVRKDGSLPYLRPDGKTQVTIGYDGQRPVSVEAVVVSTQHAPWVESGADPRGRAAARRRPDPAGVRASRCATRRCTSTRPAGSRSAARRPTRASPAARSSSTPTAAPPATAAARSAARTRRRSTAPPRTRCAGSRRTPSRPGSRTGSSCRSPTRSARPSPSGSTPRPSAPRTCPRSASSSAIREVFDLRPGRDHRRARPAPPDLRGDRGVRPLRSRAADLHLGAHRPRRRPRGGGRAVVLVDPAPFRRRPRSAGEVRAKRASRPRTPAASRRSCSTRRCRGSTTSSTTGSPPPSRTEVAPGVRVKVPLRVAGRVADGWVVAIADTSDAPGRALAARPRRVDRARCSRRRCGGSRAPVADRNAGVASDVLRLAVPKRQARVEQRWLAAERAEPVAIEAEADPLADGARRGSADRRAADGARRRRSAATWVGGWAVDLAHDRRGRRRGRAHDDRRGAGPARPRPARDGARGPARPRTSCCGSTPPGRPRPGTARISPRSSPART